MRGVILAALSATGALVVASSAQADGLAFNQDLAPPGVYYGSGNPNGDFVVDTEGGIEVGLRAHVTGQAPSASVGDLYSFGLGSSLSFDWSINPDVGQTGIPTPVAYSNVVITIHDFANNNTQMIPGVFPDTNLHLDQGPLGGYQNSERLSFGFIDSLYNANQNNTFSVNIALNTANGPISVTELLQQGSGAAVPEPASWALMMLGFGGIGAAMRRSRKTTAAATA